MKNNFYEMDSFTLIAIILTLSIVIAITVFAIHENTLKSQNINTAIEKGIDPLSVRCSYANSSDLICIAFAASSESQNVVSQIRK
jgi:hypothetical protein